MASGDPALPAGVLSVHMLPADRHDAAAWALAPHDATSLAEIARGPR